MKKQKRLKEGWVEFTRIPCQKGSIDRWVGDCINDPNKKDRSPYQLNTFATFYRLNRKGKWLSSRDFGRDFMIAIGQLKDSYSAQEIWETYLNN